MTDKPNAQKGLAVAVRRLLRPLVRLMLRYGVPFGAFSDLAKQVYVDVAMSEFDVPGRKQTVSRTSVLTGLSRKEVSRVLKLDDGEEEVTSSRYNRAARVIAAWVRESQYTDEAGNPRLLEIDSDDGFAGLVKKYSGDVPPRAILDELLRVGAVEMVGKDQVELKARSYIPEAGEAEKMHILGQDVAGLISTIEHNLQPESQPFFQRKVYYDNLPDEVMEELKKLTREQGQALIESLDHWMSQHDRDDNPGIGGTGRNRAGIGIYYFEEDEPKEAES